MANPDMAFGLRPVSDRSGRPYNGSARAYVVPASDGTALFIGDPVQLAGSADADGVPTITRATAAGGNYILGVVVGFEIDAAIRAAGYRAASTLAKVLVCDDPEILFEIQADDDSATLAAADVGLNADLIIAAGSTTTRLSGAELDTSTKNTTATLQLKIEGVVADHQNEPFVANQRVLVSINLHQRRNTTGI